MPILDQGYQHWNGTLKGHAGRWLAITRQGIRAQSRNRWVWFVIAIACLPADRPLRLPDRSGACSSRNRAC